MATNESAPSGFAAQRTHIAAQPTYAIRTCAVAPAAAPAAAATPSTCTIAAASTGALAVSFAMSNATILEQMGWYEARPCVSNSSSARPRPKGVRRRTRKRGRTYCRE